MNLNKNSQSSETKSIVNWYSGIGLFLVCVLIGLIISTSSDNTKTIVHNAEPTTEELQVKLQQVKDDLKIATAQRQEALKLAAEEAQSAEHSDEDHESDDYTAEAGDVSITMFNSTIMKTKDSRSVYIETIEDGDGTIAVLTIPESACKVGRGESTQTEPDEKPERRLFVFGASSWLDAGAKWLCGKK